jgi:hypothetical protein
LAVDDVKIDLYAGASLAQLIASKTRAAAGTYKWDVPTSLKDGSNYKVRISSYADRRVYGESAAFKISNPLPPDLIVSSLTGSLTGNLTGNLFGATKLDYSGKVSNSGGGPAETSKIRLALMDGLGLITYGQWIGDDPALASGGSFAFFGSVSVGLPPATYLLLAFADISGEVVESNQSNNDKTISLSYSPWSSNPTSRENKK